MLSNWSNTNRLKLQLQHDSCEKAKERKAVLRREVYLLAAEESVKAASYLATLPEADITKINTGQGLQGFFAIASKLQLISEPRTSLLISELVGAYSELLFKIMAKIQPIQALQTDIAIRDDFYNRAQAEVSRILAAITQFNESAKSDEAIFKALNDSFDFQQEQANKFATERNTLWQERNALHVAFVRALFRDMKIVGEHQTHVMVELRRELDVGGDIDVFMRQMDAQWQRINDQLDAFLNTLKDT